MMQIQVNEVVGSEDEDKLKSQTMKERDILQITNKCVGKILKQKTHANYKYEMHTFSIFFKWGLTTKA